MQFAKCRKELASFWLLARLFFFVMENLIGDQFELSWKQPIMLSYLTLERIPNKTNIENGYVSNVLPMVVTA
jgi:hypothetical protein